MVKRGTGKFRSIDIGAGRIAIKSKQTISDKEAEF
jgi:hypothetical protein